MKNQQLKMIIHQVSHLRAWPLAAPNQFPILSEGAEVIRALEFRWGRESVGWGSRASSHRCETGRSTAALPRSDSTRCAGVFGRSRDFDCRSKATGNNKKAMIIVNDDEAELIKYLWAVKEDNESRLLLRLHINEESDSQVHSRWPRRRRWL